MIKKSFLMGFLFCINIFVYGEVFVKIHEPIRFNNYVTRSVQSDILVGQGSLEIYTDNESEDIGKKIVFNFPDKGAMTNKKKWLPVEKYSLEKRENNMVLSKKREIVKVYAFVDRKKINRGEDAAIIEGEYIGYFPLVLSLYRKN